MAVQLRISELYKSFQGNAVLSGISLTANQGDIIVLLGSSGSGKSTLLRCINLLEIPDAGSIEIAGEQVSFKTQRAGKLTHHSNQQVTRLRRHLGMVFQQFNLWPHLTALENVIAAPIHVLGQARQAAVEQGIALLAKVGLEHKQHNYPQQLSGGQQQRVAIARALAMNPEVMLFDEPTSALDPEKVNEVLQVIKTLAQEGKTMIIATHEMGFAKQVASEVVFLDHGKIHEQGPAKQMFSTPQTVRFKQFIESVNETSFENNQ